jgi:phospholipid/cholesterol/gamma-HCH transport system substrate-binding protein
MERARRALPTRPKRQVRLVEREAHYTAVGAFVLLVVAMAGLFIYWYTDNSDRREYTRYEIYFQGSVTGLSEGGAVRYLGVDVGRVHMIRLDKRSADRVQVVADIDQQAPISDRTTAQLSLQGVTGLLYIDLRQNVDQREIIPPVASQNYPVINTVRSGFDTFLSMLPDIAGRAAELLQQAQRLLSKENAASITAVLANLRGATGALPETMHRVDTLLDDLRGTSTQVRELTLKLQSTSESIGPQMTQLSERLNSTADNFEKASAGVARLIEENRAGIAGFTQNGLPELERMLRDARAAAVQFQELSRSLTADPSRLLYQHSEQGIEVPR